MENYGYVYKTTNTLDNKVYIGQKSGEKFDPNYKGSGLYIKRAVNKYGKINFKVELIAHASSKEELNKLEKFYIAEMRKLLSDKNVYNFSDGGEGEKRFGAKNPFFGKHHSEKTRAKWSKIRTGKLSEAQAKHLAEMSANNIGKPSSAEHKRKDSIAKSGINNPMYGRTGDKNPMFGRHHSAETKEKIRIKVWAKRKNYKKMKDLSMCGKYYGSLF